MIHDYRVCLLQIRISLRSFIVLGHSPFFRAVLLFMFFTHWDRKVRALTSHESTIRLFPRSARPTFFTIQATSEEYGRTFLQVSIFKCKFHDEKLMKEIDAFTHAHKVGGTIRYGVISSAATVALSLRQVCPRWSALAGMRKRSAEWSRRRKNNSRVLDVHQSGHYRVGIPQEMAGHHLLYV